MPDLSEAAPPTLAEMAAARARLAPHILRTPTIALRADEVAARLGEDSELFLKLELLQRTGTFKARGALNTLLTAAPLTHGATAVSAGNHAIAVAFAAATLGVSAKLVMLPSANPARLQAAKDFGAEIIIEESGAAAFARAETIREEEGRLFVHPFENPRISEATAGVGLEVMEDVADLDAVVVAIGGGGLSSGLAAAVKQRRPETKVYGVEPEGADTMSRSFRAGGPISMQYQTIADSLAPPFTRPYSYGLCRRFLDDIVTVTDDEIAAAMVHMFRLARLAVEPAAAAAMAAAFGPLRARLQGLRTALIICGSNIDFETYQKHFRRGETAIAEGALASGQDE